MRRPGPCVCRNIGSRCYCGRLGSNFGSFSQTPLVTSQGLNWRVKADLQNWAGSTLGVCLGSGAPLPKWTKTPQSKIHKCESNNRRRFVNDEPDPHAKLAALGPLHGTGGHVNLTALCCCVVLGVLLLWSCSVVALFLLWCCFVLVLLLPRPRGSLSYPELPTSLPRAPASLRRCIIKRPGLYCFSTAEASASHSGLFSHHCR